MPSLRTCLCRQAGEAIVFFKIERCNGGVKNLRRIGMLEYTSIISTLFFKNLISN
jgi:hypothetical protein